LSFLAVHTRSFRAEMGYICVYPGKFGRLSLLFFAIKYGHPLGIHSQSPPSL
jgi:hypothetical protein